MKKLWIGGEGPSDLPPWLHLYLVSVMGADPDLLSRLKCVERTGLEGNVLVRLVRVFDPAAAESALEVRDFTSLDGHPHLVLYEGYREKESERIHMISRLPR